MTKENDLKKFSAAELEARRKRGESRTDLERLRAKSDAQVERELADDPDFKQEPKDWLDKTKPVTPASKK